MKHKISCVFIPVMFFLMLVIGCRKHVDTQFTPLEIGGTPLPGQSTYCRIESLWENAGAPNQRFILFLYDEFENPVAITTPVPTTGHPYRTFKYDQYHRLREYRGEYSNGNYEFWHFYGIDLNGRIGTDTMYTLGTIGATGPATYFERAISKITYDGQGRIIKVVTTTQTNPSQTETNYTYDGAGNLVRPGVTYDNKMNLNRTNDIWQFLNRDYSMNNAFVAEAYNPAGFPTIINSPGPILWLNEYQLQHSQFGYGCRPGQVAAETDLTVMSNANDPLLVRANVPGNKVIDVYATRDNLGKPIAVTDIVIKSPTDTLYYKFNAQQRLSAIFTPNGTQFHFSWISQNKANLTVLGPDGVSQLSTQVDFSSQPQVARVNTDGVERVNTPLQLSFTPGPLSQVSATAAPAQNAVISVLQCQSLTDAQVYVVAKSLSGSVLGNFPAQRISKGKYSVGIPTSLAPTINPGEYCEAIADVLGYACLAVENPSLPIYFCAALTTLVASSGYGAAFAGPVLSACTAAMAGLELYCGTFGAEPAPGAPSLADMICKSKYLDRTIVQDITITPYVIALPSNVYGLSATVTPQGNIPPLTVTLNSQTAIRTLDLVPPAPAAFQSYVAKVDVFCLQAGSLVTVSVVGTDGYQNSVNYNITSTQGEGQFTLTVPGAATPGIRDVVTVRITLPNGTIITKTASLIFV
jgi:YD repeat-containing protein